MFFLVLAIVPFPKRNDNLMENNKGSFNIAVSGSIGQYRNGKCVDTDPNDAIDTTQKNEDWCSNIVKEKSQYPWLSVNLKGKAMSLTGYSIRSGCCYYGCCCEDGIDVNCCCELYSWSLEGSHDNTTWKTLHKVEKEKTFYFCQNRSYDLKTSESFEYIRIRQDEPWPGCSLCICLNKLELYGQTRDGRYVEYDSDDSDESVSIIGKVSSKNSI